MQAIPETLKLPQLDAGRLQSPRFDVRQVPADRPVELVGFALLFLPDHPLEQTADLHQVVQRDVKVSVMRDLLPIARLIASR
jgi:hypothetical protein